MTAPFGKIADFQPGGHAWPGVAVYLARHPLVLSSVFESFGSPTGVDAALDDVEKIVRARIAQDQKLLTSSRHIASKHAEDRLFEAWQESKSSRSIKADWTRARDQAVSDLASFKSEAETFLIRANEVVRAELVAKFGIYCVDLWDFSDPPLRWEVSIESSQFSPSLNLKMVLDRFASPFTHVAKALDFYQRNRLQIRSLIARTESETLWGERNTSEILQALSRLIDKQPEPSWYWQSIVLALADDDEQAAHKPNGIQFEQDCLDRLLTAGIVASLTPSGPDKGVDIQAEIGGISVAIQCKSYNKPVGIKAVQEAHSGAHFYRCDYGVVVGDSGFTTAAEDLAVQTNVILATSTSLAKIISSILPKPN